MSDPASAVRSTRIAVPGAFGTGTAGQRRGSVQTLAVACSVALALGIAYLLAPPMGTDLSAQVARGEFVARYGLAPIDFRWYGGINQLGYSLVSPAVIAAIGARWAGVLAALVMTAAIGYVFVRTGARRPMLGAVAVAVVAIGNVASGRITFAIGAAFAAVALAVLVGPAADARGRGRARRIALLAVGGLFGLLSTITSPVAGLFVGLVAVAWMIGDATFGRDVRGWVRPGPRFVDACVLAFGAAIGLLPMLWLGDGGMQPFTAAAMRTDVALSVAVGLLIPAVYRPLRAGAALVTALLLFAFYVPSGIGSNATRLPMLFGVPLVIAYSEWRRWLLAIAVVALLLWHPPVLSTDIQQAGAPETKVAFYRPLLGELSLLSRPGAIGRIEVVPLRDHWESVYVADQVPLARGWLRQVDVARNRLFYSDTEPSAEQYGRWLRANAVEYVAVAPNQPLDVYGRSEARIIAGAPDYLRLVWQGADWRVYQVVDPDPFVTGGTLTAVTPSAVTVDVPRAGDTTIRVQWSRWLTVSGGGCLAEAPGGWTTLRSPSAGVFTISSGAGGGAC